MSKITVLILFALLLLSSLVMVGSVFAQSVPKPSVPKFALKYVDYSYDVPSNTISTTDPYTNETTTTTVPGYHVKNFTIEVAVTNQLFPSTINGNTTNLYYNVQTKGHFEEDWYSPYSFSIDSGSSGGLQGAPAYFISLPSQSSSKYTVLSFPANSYPSGGLVDFQVEAVLGYQYSYDNYFYGGDYHILPVRVNTFVYHASGWSETQTLTIDESQALTLTPSPEPTFTPEPTDSNMGPTAPPEEPLLTQEQLVIVAVTVAVLAVGLDLLVYLIKRK